MSDNVTDQKEVQQFQSELSKEQQANRTGLQMAAASQQERVENPDFLGKLQDADIDTALFDWLEDEIGAPTSGAHIIGNRGEHYEEYAELADKNWAERIIAERTPGRLLRENPMMLALSQGIRGTEDHEDPTKNPRYRKPLTAKKKRALRDAAEVLTNRKSLSIDGRGLDAVSTVTVENKTVQQEEEEATGVTGKVKGVFR
jgi:hypothetical protein